MTAEFSAKLDAERREFLSKFRTKTLDGHPTFDLELYYNTQPIEDLVALRDKTLRDLETNPNFGTEFYTDFAEYLQKKIQERS